MMILYLILSLLLIFSKTPLMMAFVVICQASLISLSIFILFLSSWFSFILFLVFISAMMIVYVYAASLASNDFVYFTSQPVLPLMLLSVPIMFIATNKFNYPLKSSSYLKSCNLDLDTSTMHKIFSSYILTTTLFLIMYLLIALVAVAKTTANHQGALRTS
uniref:NADH dehydrogenase subunit 6 n=1 Tax=Linevichella vortex TaxID=686705 RepID=A0A1L5BWB2_9CRUS|nr:NADH dehydrogenase subunit 6 [Linevichella vortex]